MKKIILFLLLFISFIYASEYNTEKSFYNIYNNVINGNISATGASVLCQNNGYNKCNWNYKGYLYNLNPLKININKKYFKYNSSGEYLKLPNNIKKEDILFAKLYWQGHVFGTGTDKNLLKYPQYIKLLTPNNKLYNLKADNFYYYGYTNHKVYNSYKKGYRLFYQASVEITDIIKNNYTGNHFYTVGDIYTTSVKDKKYIYDTKIGKYLKWGNWGGWSLIVVYKNKNEKMKNISLFDGFKFLIPHFGKTDSLTINFPLNTFFTPKYGKVNSRIIIFSGGGRKKYQLII